MKQPQAKIGDILTQQGSITETARDDAIRYQAGGRLGQVLYKNGTCNSITLYTALAKQRGLPFANLLKEPPKEHLLNSEHLTDYLSLQMLPWKHDVQDDTVLIAAVEVDEAQQQWAQEYFPKHQFVQTAPRDIHRSLNETFPTELSHQSVHKLALNSPIQSAKTLLNKSEHVPALALVTILTICLYLSPPSFIIGFLIAMSLLHLFTLSFKSLLFFVGSRKRQQVWQKYADKPTLRNDQLPSYTILVPVYKEAAILPSLINNLRALDYPSHKLDIKIIIEEDDIETYHAALAQHPEGMFEILRVPYSEPRTKPKACNYALRFAQGDIITIYDAEDKPHPQQLREVAHRFIYGEPDLVCVQCRLNYYNREQNLLTKLFSIEYAAWFDFMIPALDYMKLPIPLGGTSNHIYRQKLLELGEWDPFNVTEDADLGIRLSALRYRTEAMQSQTMEECPATLWPWIKQRSRWIKGYMQTWLVHMRRPIWLYRKMGWRGWLSFQLFIGGPCLVFLTTPILFGLSLLWLTYPPDWNDATAKWILPLSLTMLFYGVALHFIYALEVVRRRQWPNMLIATLAFPFYWLLHSIASFRALTQLITRPHYWEKTEHGHWQNQLEKTE